MYCQGNFSIYYSLEKKIDWFLNSTALPDSFLCLILFLLNPTLSFYENTGDQKPSQGSYGNGKTEFQDFFFIFQGFNFFPILYKTMRKMHSFSLILISVIRTGTTAQIEKNRIRVAHRSSTCI